MRNYPVKENQIGSAVIEIFRYKQIDILLLYYKDGFKAIVENFSNTSFA